MATAFKIQIPDTAASVTLDDMRLIINQLVITGTPVTVAHQHVDAGGDLETFVRQLIDTSATIVQHGASQATVDAVTAQVGRLIDAVTDVTAKQLPETMEEQMTVIRTVLGEHFDAEKAESIQQQLKATFTAQSAEQHKALRTAMLDDTGPLGIVKAELSGMLKRVIAGQKEVIDGQTDTGKQLAAITAQLAAADQLKEERGRGTAQGLDFEAQVGAALEWIHAPHCDAVIPVGTELGVGGNRAGDHVITLNPDETHGHEVRLVIEAKAQSLGLRAALAELDKAMANRDAQCGVLVFASAELAPLGGHALRTYGENRFIVVYDRDDQDPVALEAACRLARLLAVAGLVEDGAEIDADQIAEQLERLNAVIDEARAIVHGVTATRKGIDKIEGAYETLRDKATVIIREISDSLA